MSKLDKLDDSGLETLESIVADYNDRCRCGEKPQIEEYIERHPDLAEEIRETLPVLRKLRDLTPHHGSAAEAAADEPMPERIGEYRIERVLGRGGMGVVYLAVQESLDRTVALKVLPGSALFDQRTRERFRRESLIAAQLHHTNIVPVFGTGEADGVHYYAMQYIEGVSLDRVIHALEKLEPSLDSAGRCQSAPVDESDRFVATARRLLDGHLAQEDAAKDESSVRTSGSSSNVTSVATGYPACVARIGIQVSQALAHAHAHGVLHRDVKPSNLIIDQGGTIWVTDFGLARFDDHAGLTSTGDIVGTLRYMAPERLKGQIDARTDVYALGLTLYELLVFRPALDEYDRGRLIKSIVETEPGRPSTLKRWIPRDLETIVLKAMSKEPEARYATAQELAADLERFLAGKAVAARPIGSLGRAWRWSRRNRVVASLAALLLLVLITSLGIVTWQWRRAEANLELAQQLRVKAEESLVEAKEQRDRAEVNFLRARQAVDDYLVTISENTLLEVPTLEPVREELLEKAKSFYQGFVEERTDDPELKAELAASYIRLGQIEHDLDGDWLPLLTRGLEMVEDLAEEGASFTEFRSWREGIYNTRSGYLRTSDVEKFRPIVNRAIALWEPLVEKHPEVNGFRTDLAGLFLMRGMVHFNVGEYDVAFENFERSRQLREPLVEQHPDVEKFRYALGESYTTLGMVKIRTEKFEEALRYSTKAKELLEPIAEANPAATRLADILAAIHQWIALAQLRLNDPIKALSAYQQALNIQERLSREYPYEPHFQLNLALSYRMLGQSMFQAGQVATAKSTYEKSFDLLKQRLKDYPDKTEYRGAIATAYLDLNGQLFARKQFDDAEQAAQEALHWSDEETPDERSKKSVVHFRIGQALEAQKEYGEADESYQEAIALARSTDSIDRGWLATYLNYSARNLFRQERFADAEEAMRECLEIRRAMPNVTPVSIAVGQGFLARMLEKLDRTEEAAATFRDVIDVAYEQGDAEATYARDAVNRLVDLLRRTGSPDRAEQLLEELRRRNQDEHGMAYGPEWTVEVYELDDDVEFGEQGEAEWSDVFGATTATTLERPAVDLVWNEEPLAENVPTENFALVARCAWDLGPESVELHVHYTDLVRVYVGDEMVFQGTSTEGKKSGKVVIPPHEGAVDVRVEHIQRESGPGQLRVWARPVEGEPDG